MGIKLKEVHGEYWTPEEDSIIEEHFCYAPQNYLMNLLPGRTWKSIFMRGNGKNLKRISQDRYFIDYNFFENWSKESAYILGFITADGYVKRDTSGNRHANMLQFELASYDIDILKKFKDVLKFEGPISTTKRSTCKMQINNTKIIEDIIKKGVPSTNKTEEATFPANMPSEYAPDFIRGVFDGDGSIYMEDSNGHSRLALQILGTKDLLYGIRSHLPLESKHSYISYRGNNGANIYILSIKNKDTIKIYDWMYRASTIYLDRKYQHYMSCRNQILRCNGNIAGTQS